MEAKFQQKLPRQLVWIAVAQIVAVLVMPPSVLRSISPVIWVVVALIFALLGFNLLRRKAWARIASIFLQGFSIIVHLLIIVPNARATLTAPIDYTMILTSVVSMVLSALVLYYIDQPEVQTLLQ